MIPPFYHIWQDGSDWLSETLPETSSMQFVHDLDINSHNHPCVAYLFNEDSPEIRYAEKNQWRLDP